MKNWSEVDDAAVRRHFVDEQKSYGQIAKLYDGATVGAVAGRCRRLGLRRGTSRLAGKKRKVRVSPAVVPAQETVSAPVAAPVAAPAPERKKKRLPVVMSAVAMRHEALRQQTFVPGRVPLEMLDAGMCKWPFGDPRDPDFGFCGEPQHACSPYCSEHHAAAFSGKVYKRDES